MSASYRPDVDGLRAIAVLSVVFFHAHVPGFVGGFVGVDIFFVISGFLIGGILKQEIAQGTFSFAGFYQRRIRRILPALLAVLITTSIASWFWLLPEDLMRYGKWLCLSILMLPNVAAWQIAGDYFAPPLDAVPLLHLWSLGVEEQFYLLLPLLLLWMVRRPRIRPFSVLLWLLVLSSLLAIWALRDYASAAFYALPTRAWELLAGVIVAYYPLVPDLTGNHLLLGLIRSAKWWVRFGVVCIVVAITLPADSHNSVDGANASVLFWQCLACLGAVLIIALGHLQTSWVERVLASPPFVTIGLLSYALYLWHWPLLNFLSYQSNDLVSNAEHTQAFGVAWMLLASGVLATLTWLYIEQPCRNKLRMPFRQLFIGVVMIQLVLLSLGGGWYVWQGIPQRFANQHYAEGATDKNPLQKDCFYWEYQRDLKPDWSKCIIGDLQPNAAFTPNFMVWGDSHADALTPAFTAMAQQYGLQGVESSFSGGASLLNVRRTDWTPQDNVNYQQFVNNTLASIQHSPQLTDVFLVNRPFYALGRTPYELKIGADEAYLAYQSQNLAPLQAYLTGLQDVVQALVAANKRVWIVMPIPEMDRNVPVWLARNIHDTSDQWLPAYPERRIALTKTLQNLQHLYPDKVQLLNPQSLLCQPDNQACLVATQGYSLYYDNNHLSATGARYIAEILRPAFDTMKLKLSASF